MKEKRSRINPFKLFDQISEIVGWLQIVIGATVLSFLIGCVIYGCLQGVAGLVLGIAVVVLGMVLGVTFATRKFKTIGTINLLSRVSATPELDQTNDKEVPIKQDKDKEKSK